MKFQMFVSAIALAAIPTAHVLERHGRGRTFSAHLSRTNWQIARMCVILLIAATTSAFRHAPNDCLPAAIAVYESLPPTVWREVVTVRDAFGKRHAYCVFEFKGCLYAYDRMWGSRKISPKKRTAIDIAKAIDTFAVAAFYK